MRILCALSRCLAISRLCQAGSGDGRRTGSAGSSASAALSTDTLRRNSATFFRRLALRVLLRRGRPHGLFQTRPPVVLKTTCSAEEKNIVLSLSVRLEAAVAAGAVRKQRATAAAPTRAGMLLLLRPLR